MRAVDSLSDQDEQIHPSATIGSHESPESEEQLAFPIERVLSEPNRDENQTGLWDSNGSSSELRAQLDRFLLAKPLWPETREWFQALQKWEGHVISVGEDTFAARLVTISGEGPDQEAEIYIEEVASGDRALIEPGAVFYWSIGYLERPSGRLRVSVIRFRRLPVWSKRELENASREAERLRSLLDAE